MEYILVVEALTSEQAKRTVVEIFDRKEPEVEVTQVAYLISNRYAVRIRLVDLDPWLSFPLEGALNSVMNERTSHLVWWNRVTAKPRVGL